MRTQVKVVNTMVESRDKIEELKEQGYSKETTYVLSYEKARAEAMADHTEISNIGIIEEGIITSMANLFRSRSEELIAKMRSLGIAKPIAEHLEQQLSEGRMVIIAWGGNLSYNEEREDREILYDPELRQNLYVGSKWD